MTPCFEAIRAAADHAQRGDLGGIEGLLVAQALTLNAVFTDLASTARLSTRLDFIDPCLRLALRAQGQCRATCETLATIKNPPAVFARQANITSGPQQVNNALAPARNSDSAPSKLLEAQHERMDLEPASATATSDPAMATVGALDRSADARGESASGAERVPGRPAGKIPGSVQVAGLRVSGATRRASAHSV